MRFSLNGEIYEVINPLKKSMPGIVNQPGIFFY